jgi:hypothetical protein
VCRHGGGLNIHRGRTIDHIRSQCMGKPTPTNTYIHWFFAEMLAVKGITSETHITGTVSDRRVMGDW